MDEASEDTFVPPTLEELASLFPSYEFEGFIAKGGMGAVYLARQCSLDRPVAFKILPREWARDASFRKSFEAEAKIMAQLNHPNLVTVYDFGEVAGLLYIVMEFVNGQTLYDAAYGQKIDHIEAVRLVSALAGGLEYAHSNGIIHYDIKPSNVLLTPEAEPKLVDFGLARSHEMAEQEEVFGTPGYSAPEVFEDGVVTDHRADIYSLGVILYELLTSRLPEEPYLPPRELCKSNVILDTIIAKALQKDSSARYQSSEEFVEVLEAYIKSPEYNAEEGESEPAAGQGAGFAGVPAWLWLCVLVVGGIGIYLQFFKKSPAIESEKAEPIVVDIRDIQAPKAKVEVVDVSSEERTEIVPPVSEETELVGEGALPKEGVPSVNYSELLEGVAVPKDFQEIIETIQGRAAPFLTSFHENLDVNYQGFEVDVERLMSRVSAYRQLEVRERFLDKVHDLQGSRVPLASLKGGVEGLGIPRSKVGAKAWRGFQKAYDKAKEQEAEHFEVFTKRTAYLRESYRRNLIRVHGILAEKGGKEDEALHYFQAEIEALSDEEASRRLFAELLVGMRPMVFRSEKGRL